MPPFPSNPAATTALLRHDPPGARGHFDWLVVIEGPSPAPEDRTVPCFRLTRRLDLLTPGSRVEAQEIGPHRGLYLDLATPRRLDGGRGLVRPRRRGDVFWTERRGDDLLVGLRWRPQRSGERPGAEMTVRVQRRAGGRAGGRCLVLVEPPRRVASAAPPSPGGGGRAASRAPTGSDPPTSIDGDRP